MALPMMLGSCLASGVALYFTSKATRATTIATSSCSPLSSDPEETESLSSPDAFDSGRSVEAAVVDGVVEGNSSVGEGGGTKGRRAEVEPSGLWETAKNKFRWAKAKLKSRAERVTLGPEENTASSLVSGDREEMESPGSDILSLSPAAFESGHTVEAAVATECNIPSPVAPVHAADGSKATETDVDPVAVGSTLAAECNMGSANVADAVHAAEGSEATEATDGVSSEVEVYLMAVGNTLATERKSTRAVDLVHAAAVSEATEAEVDPRAVGSALAAECNMPRVGAANAVHAAEGSKATECNMLLTGGADVVNTAVVYGDVEGSSSDRQGCNVHGVVAEAGKVGEEGGATGRRGEVEPPGLWEAAKRKFMRAKAKLKSGAEWMMLDPAVVRRILKSMFLEVVDSVVNRAFKRNTVEFRLSAILISELKRCK